MWYRLLNVMALAVVMSLLAVAAGCTDGNSREAHGQGAPNNGTSRMHHMAPLPEAAPRVASASHEAAQEVKIDNFTFDPPTLTIAAGTKVTWVNRDDVPHTATSTAKPKRFNSGTLDTDQQFSHVFTESGTYDYFCAVHPKMTGRIIVK
jgi:plastocyanin